MALQWDARPTRDKGIEIIVFRQSEQAWPGGEVPPCRSGAASCDPWERAWTSERGGPAVPPPPPGFVLIGERLHHGIYVRREWGREALLWGALLPLLLFAAAGFVALGRAERQG
jgi:hypothetical protein